jgi:hypothetical protein
MGTDRAPAKEHPTATPEVVDDSWLAILSDRAPLDILAETPDRLVEVVAERDGGRLLERPESEAWSVAEIIGHLADAEIAYAARWRLILTRDAPRYPGLNQLGQVALPRPPLADMVQLFTALRAYNLWLLRRIPAADWQRTGLHEDDGPETVEFNARKLAAHDLDHLEQIERVLTVMSAS